MYLWVKIKVFVVYVIKEGNLQIYIVIYQVLVIFIKYINVYREYFRENKIIFF